MASKSSLEASVKNTRAKGKRVGMAVGGIVGVFLGAGIGGKLLPDMMIPKTQFPVNFLIAGVGVGLSFWAAFKNKPGVFGVGMTMVGFGVGQVFLGSSKNPIAIGKNK